MELSARNQLAGTVARLTLGAVMAEVVIEIGDGTQIVAAITRAAAESLGLAEGREVVAVVKATDVMVGTVSA